MKRPWKERYLEHLKSIYWATLKKKVIKRRGYQCEKCHAVSVRLDLHHEHYKTFGKERQKDVVLLCRNCHKVEDLKRKIRGQADKAWYRLCGDFGGNVSEADIQLLIKTGRLRESQR